MTLDFDDAAAPSLCNGSRLRSQIKSSLLVENFSGTVTVFDEDEVGGSFLENTYYIPGNIQEREVLVCLCGSSRPVVI